MPEVRQDAILYCLPNLRALKLLLDTGFPLSWPSYLSSHPLCLDNLTELSLIFNGTYSAAIYDILSILPAFQLPRLYTLFIGGGIAESHSWNHEVSYDDLARSYKHSSTVKDLIFQNAALTPAALELILAFIEELQSFNFNGRPLHPHVMEDCVEFEDILTALAPFRKSLRKIHIDGHDKLK